MSYHHLSLAERHYIEIERKAGKSMSLIGRALNRSQSSISRELKRTTGQRGYRHQQADRLAAERHALKPKAIKLTAECKALIRRYLEQDWSPEQIVGRLKQEGRLSLHHETIYQYILADKKAGGQLYRQLRHQNKTYRKRYGSPRNRSGIPNRVDIDERPEIVNQRQRLGDWEADTIIGKQHQGAIVTLDERQSKLRLAAPLAGKKAEPVKQAMVALLQPFKAHVHTITYDNGKEFTRHEAVAATLECETYFAKPYHSWERGQNENANGLLRQYFPKTITLLDVTRQQVLEAVHKLNTRPRKCLGFRTPAEVFMEKTGLSKNDLIGYALMS